MKKIVVVLAAPCVLASCGDASSDRNTPPLPVAAVVAKTGGGSNNRIVKVCDQGRLIYAIRDDNSAALAIVENAPECRR